MTPFSRDKMKCIVEKFILFYVGYQVIFPGVSKRSEVEFIVPVKNMITDGVLNSYRSDIGCFLNLEVQVGIRGASRITAPAYLFPSLIVSPTLTLMEPSFR